MSLRHVSGVWTFLLAILISIAAGVIGFEVTASLLVTLGLSAAALVAVVAVCQWL